MSSLLHVFSNTIHRIYPLVIHFAAALLFFFLLCQKTPAQVHRRTGTDAFSSLSRPQFAKPSGIAGAYTALASGPEAIGTNPAGLSAESKHKPWVSAGLQRDFLEIHSGELAYTSWYKKEIGYGLSLRYENMGTIEEIEEDSTFTGKEISPYSLAAAFTLSKRLYKSLAIGGTVKLPTEYLGDFYGSKWALGWGVDAGFLYWPNSKRWTFGMSALNLGRKEIAHVENGETGEWLPMEVRAGATYQGLPSRRGKLSLDLAAPYHAHPYAALGFEHPFSPYFSLRAGSRINYQESSYWLRKFVLSRKNLEPPAHNALKLAAGVTLQPSVRSRLQLDYAAQYWSGLGLAHYLTVKYRV